MGHYSGYLRTENAGFKPSRCGPQAAANSTLGHTGDKSCFDVGRQVLRRAMSQR
jgi:hypothetical protein